MLSEIHIGARVTDGERQGRIEVILSEPRRGLPGAAVTDVQVRWDGDDVSEWVNPDDLFAESHSER